MAMTRKDFQELAMVIASLPEQTTREEVSKYLANYCQRQNYNFDRDRFLNAVKEHSEAWLSNDRISFDDMCYEDLVAMDYSSFTHEELIRYKQTLVTTGQRELG